MAWASPSRCRAQPSPSSPNTWATPPDGDPIRLYHLDLYRLGGEEDLDDIGFDDLLAPSRWHFGHRVARARRNLASRSLHSRHNRAVREDTRRLTLNTSHLGREIVMPPFASEKE